MGQQDDKDQDYSSRYIVQLWKVIGFKKRAVHEEIKQEEQEARWERLIYTLVYVWEYIVWKGRANI